MSKEELFFIILDLQRIHYERVTITGQGLDPKVRKLDRIAEVHYRQVAAVIKEANNL